MIIFKKLYCYAEPDMLENQRFNDDVAICKAKNKAKAIEKFSKMYYPVHSDNVKRVKFNKEGIYVATDY